MAANDRVLNDQAAQESATPEEVRAVYNPPLTSRYKVERRNNNWKSGPGRLVTGQGPNGSTTSPDADKKEDTAPTLATVMDAITKLSDTFGARLDTLEGKSKGKDSEHIITPPNDKKKAADADDSITDEGARWRMRRDRLGEVTCTPDNQDAFAIIQARADKVYSMNGQQANKPLHGETLIAYRRRMLLPLQKYSETFKNSDLRVVAVDPAAFDAVEGSIYKSAADAAFNPATVPLGHLRQHVEVRGGHTYTTFTGRPVSWMAAFAPVGKRIKRINQHNNNGTPTRVIFGSP